MKNKLYTKYYLLLIIILLTKNYANAIPTISPKQNALSFFYENNLTRLNSPIRLHLGCGQTKFKGYINIDFPPSEHTVQNIVAADMFANITKLKFPANCLDEVRSHHVFEHFPRAESLGLLCAWHHALKVGGTLLIETPDFLASLHKLIAPNISYHDKQGILRHVFGSHEASWAIHCDGWYEEKYQDILPRLGFRIVSIEKTKWPNGFINNIIVHAVKETELSYQELEQRAGSILRDSLVHPSAEESLWNVWRNLLHEFIQEVKL